MDYNRESKMMSVSIAPVPAWGRADSHCVAWGSGQGCPLPRARQKELFQRELSMDAEISSPELQEREHSHGRTKRFLITKRQGGTYSPATQQELSDGSQPRGMGCPGSHTRHAITSADSHQNAPPVSRCEKYQKTQL